MASLLAPRRTDAPLALHASAPAHPDDGPTGAEDRVLRIGWPLAAALGAVVSLAVGWLIVAGCAVLGWLSGAPGSLAGALEVGTRLWLAGHGVGVTLGRLQVTLVPWGIALGAAFLLSRSAAFAARSARPGTEPRPVAVAAVLLGTYGVPVGVVALLQGRPSLAPGHIAAVAVVLFAAALHGAARALGVRLTARWPQWLRPVPRAVVGAQLVLAGAGLVVLLTGILRHLDRVQALQDGLGAGVTGTVALVVAQLTLVPNAVVWATSYALGAGFTLGNASIISPATTDIGVLPALPLLGALPAEGPGPATALWWLVSGLLAGVVAAWLVVRHRPAARFDETALVGGLAGLVGGLVFVGVAWSTSGDLGTVRLAGLGPLLLPLLVMGTTTLGLSGMITGLLLGLVRLRRRTSPPPAQQPTPDTEAGRAHSERAHSERAESTQVLRRR